MHQLRVLGLVACCVWLSWTGTVHADAVTDWNEIAVQTIIAPPARPVPISFLDMAIVQAAVYDAVQAIDRRFEPYHVEIPGASGSPEAAAAKAAHDVLVYLFPAQAASLDTTFQQYLAAHGLWTVTPAWRWGQPPPPESSPCAPTTVASHLTRFPSSAALAPANGARRNRSSAPPLPPRPSPRCSHRGLAMSPPSH